MSLQRRWGGKWGRSQKGEGRLGCIIWSLLLITAVFIAFKMIPVKLASVELYDFMLEQAKFGYGSTAGQIKGRIIKKARSLDLPLDEKKVKVQQSGDRIRMSAEYMVPVEFPFYTYEWYFVHEVDRPIFIF